MVRTCRFEKFLEVLIRLPCLALLEVTLGGHHTLLVGAIHFLVVVVITGSNYDLSGVPFLPFLLHLVPFLAPFSVALDGGPQLVLGTIFPSPRTKMALAASSPEACRVAISSNSLVVPS
jgi:hypothetical protein